MSLINESHRDAVPQGTASFVFWDGYGLEHPYSGVGFYGSQLFESLKSMRVHPNIIASRLPFFGKEQAQIVAPTFPKKLRASKLVWPRTSYARAIKFMDQAKSAGSKSGIFHGLSNINVPWNGDHTKLKTAVTVHDLTPLIAPKLVSSAYAMQFAFAMRRIMRDVDSVVAVSEWTKRTIEDFFPKFAHKVQVIRNGRPLEFVGGREKPPEQQVSVLTVSRFEGYKNLEAIGKVCSLAGPEIRFDIVSDDRANRYFANTWPKLMNAGRIKVHVNAGPEQIHQLYGRATVYFQPSLYEGFCLTAVDAMGHGLPFVYLRGSAVDELASSEVGIGTERNEPEGFYSAIQEAVRKSKSPDFLENAKSEFLALPTWDDAARQLKSLYTELL